MTIHREDSDAGDNVRLTFTLPDDGRGGDVSVVGSFNNWTPGEHPLQSSGDGFRSAIIVVPASTDIHFRYLGSHGEWFDDPDSDEVTDDGGTIRASHTDTDVAPAGTHTLSEAVAMGPLPGSTLESDETATP